MNDDQAMRARVAGREAVAARTAWQLTVGGLRVRCLRQENGWYEVQANTNKGWVGVALEGNDALILLQRVSISKGTYKAFREWSGSNSAPEPTTGQP